MCKKIKTGGKSIKHRKEKNMKNASKYLFAISSAIAGCLFVGGVVKSVKKCRSDIDGNDTEYEEELAEIQANHDTKISALQEAEKKNKAEHEKRMENIEKRHDEKLMKMEKIREELLTNMDLCKGASPDEISYLLWRNEELLKELHEIAIS